MMMDIEVLFDGLCFGGEKNMTVKIIKILMQGLNMEDRNGNCSSEEMINLIMA